MNAAASVEEFAPAKVNLSLKVLGRRSDGYHQLESLVVFARAGDRLTAHAAADLSLDISGAFGAMLAGEGDNLVLRAGRLLASELGREAGAHLLLEKNLPVASGIGGGSADAAATLRALKRLWDADVSEEQLAALALSLGADVPVCLDARPAFMHGRGEQIARLEALPHFALLLVNPGVEVSTACVFKTLAAPIVAELPTASEAPRFSTLDALIGWLEANGNDLEGPAREIAPVIGEVIAAIGATRGCRLARMSGSGATCFGIYASEDEARGAADAIARPGWWLAAA
ncbi:4-(cytidine 5'-diphospho)-2-C-methyl-D-erythritol kinase [Parvibaculum sedimenti]|uniref:4-diphosphocytidyl-2-C-methyl-D-erythritol kinase n=1 Tax=Parvibaculum sedimenti TaxID=2608632 RepID=A0A6N6VG85_9HYPH|nr:4-(cytidine 5'-diphospho)-2-C-methyl-D-erythritol kinase [Parvibaculum sedimenti]KAB7739903.1 4-(cytidine 5'-diphospho)-2-C-methyl-D-erythritol kinase [Parvibaculum sedimenti]